MTREYHGMDVFEYFINLKEAKKYSKKEESLNLNAIKEMQKWSMKKYGRKLSIKELTKGLMMYGSTDKDGNVPKIMDRELTAVLNFVDTAEKYKNVELRLDDITKSFH